MNDVKTEITGITALLIIFAVVLVSFNSEASPTGGDVRRIINPHTNESTIIGYKATYNRNGNVNGAVFYQPGSMKKGVTEWRYSGSSPYEIAIEQPEGTVYKRIDWGWGTSNLVVFDGKLNQHNFNIDKHKLSLIEKWDKNDKNKRFLKTKLFQKIWGILPHYPKTATFDHPASKGKCKFWFRPFRNDDDNYKYVIYKLNYSSDLYRKKDRIVLTIDEKQFPLKWKGANVIIINRNDKINRLKLSEEAIDHLFNLTITYKYDERFSSRLASIIEILESKD